MNENMDPMAAFEQLVSIALQTEQLVAVDLPGKYIPLAMVTGFSQLDGEEAVILDVLFCDEGETDERLVVYEHFLEEPDEAVILHYVMVNIQGLIASGDLEEKTEKRLSGLVFSTRYFLRPELEAAGP